MARVAILGASGGLGQHLVTEALTAGYDVNALVRNPRKLQRANERLTVIQGDARTGDGLDAAVERCRYVVWALASSASSTPAMAQCAAMLLKQLGPPFKLKQLVFVSRVGVGESLVQGTKVSGPLQPLLPKVMRATFKDLDQAEQLIRRSTVPYTVVRCTRLTDDGPSKRPVEVVTADADPPSRISRIDAARFIIGVLETPDWVGQDITIGTHRDLTALSSR